MRVTYFGQACILVEVGGRRILTDPWLTEGAYSGTWFHTHLLSDAGVTPETFPTDIDYLFLSHEHEDHVDPASLKRLPATIPVLICKFPTPRFRRYVESLGFHNIIELTPWTKRDFDGFSAWVFRTAEYTDDAALLIEGDGCKVFNETDCKLRYNDLEQIGLMGIDIGFYMFSGANWYPMMYEYPQNVQKDLVRWRRSVLLKNFVQRVKLTKPRLAVPAAGPCTVLHPDLLWLNSDDLGIFIDPQQAVDALANACVPAEALYMAATDVWDSRSGFEARSPALFRQPRESYVRESSARLARQIYEREAAEPRADSDLPRRLADHFNTLLAAQSEATRRLIKAKVAFVVKGPNGGKWTVDFNAPGPEYVFEGLMPDWSYKIEVEDKLLYPFLTGRERFFEHLLLSMRVRLARRPDQYNEPLYHFFYDPDPEKLHNWYAPRPH